MFLCQAAVMKMGWVSSGDALHEEDQVQPLNKLPSHSQEGSWSHMLCIDESLKKTATAFLGPNPGTEADWKDRVLSRMNLSWRALVALAGELAWCGGPDGESIKYSGVSYILETRKKSRFPDLGAESALGCPAFLFS